jgi:hypothetical protein
VDDVLARQTRDVRTILDVFAIDAPFASKRPRSDGRARAATENYQIELFWLRLVKEHGRAGVSVLFMRLFLSQRQAQSWLASI